MTSRSKRLVYTNVAAWCSRPVTDQGGLERSAHSRPQPVKREWYCIIVDCLTITTQKYIVWGSNKISPAARASWRSIHGGLLEQSSRSTAHGHSCGPGCGSRKAKTAKYQVLPDVRHTRMPVPCERSTGSTYPTLGAGSLYRSCQLPSPTGRRAALCSPCRVAP